MSLFHNRRVADHLRAAYEPSQSTERKHSPSGKFPRIRTEHSNEKVISVDKWKINQQYGQPGVHSYRNRVASPKPSGHGKTGSETRPHHKTEPTESPEVFINRSKEMIGLIK